MGYDGNVPRTLSGKQAAAAAAHLRRFVELESGEHVLLAGLAARVHRWPSPPGFLALTNCRIVFGRRPTLPARLFGYRGTVEVIPLDTVETATAATRWFSLRSGLWGASTLSLVTHERAERFSTYGAKWWVAALRYQIDADVKQQPS